jgi:hypothetical protein
MSFELEEEVSDVSREQDDRGTSGEDEKTTHVVIALDKRGKRCVVLGGVV